MTQFIGPNEVRNVGKSTALNQRGTISPAQFEGPKQHQRFATGNIPQFVPRVGLALFPSSFSEMQPQPPTPPTRR